VSDTVHTLGSHIEQN